MGQNGTENRGLDKDLFDIVREVYDNQSCHQTMGFKVTYLGKGIAGMKTILDPKFSTEGGRVHGGVIATLADSVMGAAAATLGYIYRTLDISLNYLAPVFVENELIAEGYVIHSGKTAPVVESNIFNNEGKLIAKSRATFFRDIKAPNLL
jgi:acyl-CoA thioesterase